MKSKILRDIFGKKFGLSDLFLILSLFPAIYFTYMGIEFESGILAVYMDFIAKPLAFATVSKILIQNIFKLAKR